MIVGFLVLETQRQEGVETRRHEDTKAQSFFKTKLLINGICFQPFERIELIEPFERFLNTTPRHEVFLNKDANKWNLLPTF